MRLPDFLIVGAAKAGTTSLYRDLLANPAVFFPRDKEPGDLTRDEVLTEAGTRRYADFFSGARPDQVCGEASTVYTMLPDRPGVPQRARRVAGGRLKVIYLVREPVARTMSQYHHMSAAARVPAGIDRAVREVDELINYSRYAMQIEPWIETFGADGVRIVQFERYVGDRRATVASVSRFLGVEPRPDLIDETSVFNPSRGKPVATGPVGRMVESAWYRRILRPLLPPPVRDRLRRRLLPKAAADSPPPSLQTIDLIIERVRDDAERLRRIVGAPEPMWDFDLVRRKLASLRPADVAR